MFDIKTELYEMKGPVTMAGGSILLSLLSRKLIGHQLGINTHSFEGVGKAFLAISTTGFIMIELNKRGYL